MRRSWSLLAALAVACTGEGDDTGGAADAVAICAVEDSDVVELGALRVSGDRLYVNVAYSGGCETHTWAMCWDGSFMESSPVQARLSLDHDAHEDACEAWITEELGFDLEAVREGYEAYYPGSPGEVILILGEERVSYTF